MCLHFHVIIGSPRRSAGLKAAMLEEELVFSLHFCRQTQHLHLFKSSLLLFHLSGAEECMLLLRTVQMLPVMFGKTPTKYLPSCVKSHLDHTLPLPKLWGISDPHCPAHPLSLLQSSFSQIGIFLWTELLSAQCSICTSAAAPTDLPGPASKASSQMGLLWPSESLSCIMLSCIIVSLASPYYVLVCCVFV